MSKPNEPRDASPSQVWNVPNAITGARIVLSLVVYVLLPLGCYWAALILFLVAALTDKVDGWYARKYNLVTKLGRILDPLADKLIICGTFIFLVAEPSLTTSPWGLQAWMVVVIVIREMLVTTLRSLIEGHGGDFSAQWSGKIKMVFQCVAAGLCLLHLCLDGATPDWITWAMIGSLWIAVLSTIHSGMIYVVAAAKTLGDEASA